MGRLKTYLATLRQRDFRAAVSAGAALPAYKVKLKLTTRCNLRCAKCNYWRAPRTDDITTAAALDFIRQAAKSGARFIKFSGGEVLLRADLPRLIRAAKRRGLETSITTNATLLDRVMAKALCKAGLDQVNISLDAAAAPVHDALVGVAGSWARSVAAFANLRRISRWPRPRLVLQAVVCADNLGGMTDLARLAKDIGADSIALLSFVPDHLAESRLTPTREAIAAFIAVELADLESSCRGSGLTLVNAGYSTDDLAPDPYFAGHACYIPWLSYYVCPDGNVYPCCFTKQRQYRLGNILRQRLPAILAGEAARAFRAQAAPQCTAAPCLRCRSEIRTNRLIEQWLARRS